jgi:hypothetical protein
VSDDHLSASPPDNAVADNAIELSRRIDAEVKQIVVEAGANVKLNIGYEKLAGHRIGPIIIINNITQAGPIVKDALNVVMGDQMIEKKRDANDVLYMITVACMVLGIVFVIGGLGLVALGGTGTTTFNLFGNTLNSQNTGVASIVAGAITVAVTLRRVIKGVERTNRR